MNNDDRIKLAKAIGWSWEEVTGSHPFPDWHGGQWSAPDGELLLDIVGCEVPPPFDPFTDANDDYAVRDHFVSIGKATELADALHHLIVLRRDPTVTNSNNYGLDIEDAVTDIQKGDYARAALKVLP